MFQSSSATITALVQYNAGLWESFLKSIGAAPRLRPGDGIGDVSSSLSDAKTKEVLSAITDAKLDGFLRVKQIANLEITPVFNTGRLDLDLATGLTFPPGSPGYPRILVKAFTRPDHLPFDKNLEPGVSNVVAVMKSPVSYMKNVLVHELGHHVIFEGDDGVRVIIQQAFQATSSPVSVYGGYDWQEYFCESLAAHTYYPKILRRFDKIGYIMVTEVLKLLPRG